MKQHVVRLTIGASVVTACLVVAPSASAQAQTTPRHDTATGSAGAPEDAAETLEDRIAWRIETDDLTRRYDIDVDVEGNVVTVSGTVANERQKARVLELAKADGVVRIEERIEVDPDVDRTLAERATRGLNRAGQALTDAWITTKVRWFFVGEDVLDGSDIDVSTTDRVVTLAGRVSSPAARTRARLLAEQTDGVRDVRDQLRVAPRPD